MFRRKNASPQAEAAPLPRITSVVADGVSLSGKLTGAGGVRIEGAYDGEIELDGLFVIGPTGRVTCPQLRARHVIIAGALRGDILAERVEIRANGRVWGNVVTASMSTEEGAFLRGQIQMEEQVELGIQPPVAEAPPPDEAAAAAEEPPQAAAPAAEPPAEPEAKARPAKPAKPPTAAEPEKKPAGKFRRKK
ncbi:MAG: polymer-forming cytoskeletal protein [Anaerolineales bacterium]|nr:polymer-forming cytoskeletal protein [Anaerolineales bacterium]